MGRPRSADIGTMAFNCFAVDGCASGSNFTAAVMTLSSCRLGITTTVRLVAFSILLCFAPAQRFELALLFAADEVALLLAAPLVRALFAAELVALLLEAPLALFDAEKPGVLKHRVASAAAIIRRFME